MADYSSSSGSIFVISVFGVGIALLVLLLLRHYLPLRSTPAYLLVPVFLALFLPASIVLLVPIDLASSVVSTSRDDSPSGIWLPTEALLVLWRIAYWLTFVLTWFVLPLLGDYADSGHREPKERVIYSLRTNARYQAIVLACAIAGLVYFFISSGVEAHSLKGMIMALAYAWGLVLAIYLMGHGLVAVPRRLLRNASVSGRLRRLQGEAPRLHERFMDSIDGLDAIEGQVLKLRQRKTGTARDFQEWIDELAESSDMPEARISLAPASHPSEVTVPAVITGSYLADLTRKLKRARHRRIRFIEEWDSCVKEAQRLQAILDAAGSQRLDFDSSLISSTWPWKRSLLTPYTRYHLHATLGPGLRLFLFCISALASISIIWTEIFSRAVPSLSIVALTIVRSNRITFSGQVISALWLFYMTAAALTSISEVRVWGNRALVRRHTYAESACWYASLVARLTVPLSYNFITFLRGSVYEKTAFFQFLGKLIVLTPLGTNFSKFFPMLILLPVVATAFNLYGKVSALTGFGAFEDESGDDGGALGGGWRDGKVLIEREVNGLNAVGLATRDASPRPGPARPAAGVRGAASTDSTSARLLSQYRDEANPGVPTGAPTSAQASFTRTTRRVAPVQEEDDTESGFFTDFTHRVRNTLDTVDRPDWVRGIEFKKPKWMSGPNAGGTGSVDSGRGGLQKWFGRAGEGGVRL